MTRSAILCLVAMSCASLAFGQTLPCRAENVFTISDCPLTGCAVRDTPEAEANRVKNTPLPAGRTPKRLTLDDFERLQGQVLAVKSPQGLAVKDRSVLQGKIRNQIYREGELVDVRGFIVGTPHARRLDPASCLLVGQENNSFRINIAGLPGDSEYDSIVVEMVARKRCQGWTLRKLQMVRDAQQEVHVTGKLFYDNKHLVNSDPEDPVTGEPKRRALWEIHPVNEFEFCSKKSGDTCSDPLVQPLRPEDNCADPLRNAGRKPEDTWKKLEDMP